MYSEADLQARAGEILAALKHKRVLLTGDLGAGKTSLVKALTKKMGILDKPSSPSFSLVNVYRLKHGEEVFHIDLYRIENIEDAFNLGIEEYLYSDNWCFIEWPQIILDYIEEPYHVVRIDIGEDQSREIFLR